MNWGDRERAAGGPPNGDAGARIGWGLLVLLSVVVFGSARPAGAAPAGQAGPPPDLGAIRKPILVRLADGTAVPGLRVQLAPAAPELGGPPLGTAGRQGSTDATGTASFGGLGPWIWMVSFAGSFQGRAVVAATTQGQAPYGRTRAGGGFPVQVEVQEEDAPPTPEVIAGVVQPLEEPATFVLVPVGRTWVPALDLAGPDAPPRPVTPGMPPPLGTPAPGPAASSAGPAADHGDLGLWIALSAAGLLALGASLRARNRRASRAPGGDA